MARLRIVTTKEVKEIMKAQPKRKRQPLSEETRKVREFAKYNR